MVYGLGYGASFTLVQSRAARLFGRREGFARLQSFLVLCQYIGSFAGVTLTAQLRDLTGSYAMPFLVFPVLALLTTLHAQLSHRSAQHKARTQSDAEL